MSEVKARSVARTIDDKPLKLECIVCVSDVKTATFTLKNSQLRFPRTAGIEIVMVVTGLVLSINVRRRLEQ